MTLLPSASPEQPEHMLEVQRLLGRCPLRLQQYEKLLRAVVGSYEFGGPVSEAEKAQKKKRKSTAKAPLGSLVDEFLGEVVTGGDGPVTSWTELDEAAVQRGEPVVKIRFGIPLEDADRQQLKADIKSLVVLRNKLVHRFIELYALRTEDGCRYAAAFLTGCLETIGARYQRLLEMAKGMDEAKAKAVELMATDEFAEKMLGLTDIDTRIGEEMADGKRGSPWRA